jgi:cell division protein FtsL/ketosteroid isomerase-like protein
MRDRPYRGLMPFSERQAPFFFGRDGERKIVAANLLASRLTVLYGPSGVGKSSLLNAGVACHLRRLAQQNREEYGAPEFSVIVFGAWRDDPRCGLARVLSQQISEDIPGRLAGKLDQVSSRLDCDLLIILDQFEEYFLYHPNEDSQSGFASEFAEAVNQSVRTSFLISIREDSLAKLDRFEGAIPGILGNRLRVDHLNIHAAREAIQKPLEQFNRLRLHDEPPVTIEDALVEKVLRQVATGRMVRAVNGDTVVSRPIASHRTEERVETPYLQLVMTRLWNEEQRAGSDVMRAETLDRLGGAEKIVGTHLDAAMSSLTPAETEVAARIFNHLVTPSRTKIAHSVADLANYAGVTPDALALLLQKLSTGENRLLVPVAPSPDQTSGVRYQILHDILAGSVLEWRARYVQSRQRAEAEAKAEEQRRKAEQETHARMRLRKLSILLLVMAIVATACAVVAGLQMRTAEARQLEAETATLEAEAAKHTAEARRLELEAAVKERTAAERASELNRLEAEAARAELRGALERAKDLRQRAAETKEQVYTAQAASVALNREAQKERRSAATDGIDRALQRYQAAYRTLDLDALLAVYPRLTDDRRKHFRKSRSACTAYDVALLVRRRSPSADDTVIVEAHASYQCTLKGSSQLQTFQMSEAFWLRKDANGAWIIDKISAPVPSR